MDFRMLNAVVQMRVNSQPLSYALDRQSVAMQRFLQKYSTINITFKAQGLAKAGRDVDTFVDRHVRKIKSIGQAFASTAKSARSANAAYHAAEVANTRSRVRVARAAVTAAIARQTAAAAAVASATTPAGLARATAAYTAATTRRTSAETRRNRRVRERDAAIRSSGIAAMTTRPLYMLGEAAGYAVKHLVGIPLSIYKTIKPMEKFGALIGATIHGLTGLATAATQAALSIAKFSVGIAIGIGASIALAMKSAGDQESAMVNIGRVADLTGKHLENLKDKILDLATTSAGATLKDLNEIAEFGARMGIGEGMGGAEKGDAIANFTKSVSKLRLALDDIPVDEAATKIVRILKVFGEGPEKIENFASALVKLDNASTATGRDILELTRRLSGITATMGMLPEDVAAISTSMRDFGIEVHVGGTALQQLFLAMGARSKDFSKVLKINQQDLKHAMDTSPVDALRLVLGTLAKYKPRVQMELLHNLHMQGRMTASTILQLSKGFHTLDHNIALARGEWESLESVENAVALRSQTAWAKLHMLANQILVLGENIGKQLLPAFKEFVDMLGDVSEAVRRMYNEYLSEAIEGLVSKVVKGIRTIRAMVANLPEAISIVSAYINLIIQRIQDSFIGLGLRIWEKMKSIMKKIGEALVAAWPAIASVIMNLGMLIGGAIMAGIKAALKGSWLEQWFATERDKLEKEVKDSENEYAAAAAAPAGSMVPIGGGLKVTKEKAMRMAAQRNSNAKAALANYDKNNPPQQATPPDFGAVGDIFRKFFTPNANDVAGMNARGVLGNIQEFMLQGRIRGLLDDFNKSKLPQQSPPKLPPQVSATARYKDISPDSMIAFPKIDKNFQSARDANGNMIPTYWRAGNALHSLGITKSEDTDTRNTRVLRDRLLMNRNEEEKKLMRDLNPGIFNPAERKPITGLPESKVLKNNKRLLERSREMKEERLDRGRSRRDEVRFGESGRKIQTEQEIKGAILGMSGIGAGIGIAGATSEALTKRRRRLPPGGMMGLEPPEQSDYKPEFFGLQEFSQKIQKDLFDPKKEKEDQAYKAAMDTATNTSNINTSMSLQNGYQKKIQDDIAAIRQQGLGTLV